MKHLIVVRHAKSSWKHPGLGDFDRPLSGRGERDAPRMAERLAGRVDTLDAIVTSTAARALATARAFAAAFELDEARVRLEPELYLASVETWLAAIRDLDDSWERVATIGHNPGATMLVQALTGAGVVDMPTCAVAELELDVSSWREVAPGHGRLGELDFPKREES